MRFHFLAPALFAGICSAADLTGNWVVAQPNNNAHMSLWAMLAAPLLAGNDLRAVPPNILAILTNRDVIAVDQDKAAKQGVRVWQSGEQEIWVRQLDGGDRAVAVFDRGAAQAIVNVQWASLQMSPPTRVRDLWTHQDEHFQGAEHSVTVPAHGVVMWRVK